MAASALPRVLHNSFGQPASCFAGDPTRDRSMLLIPCEIAGFDLEMLVDTGAQESAMSAPLMHQLGLAGRLDQSQQGMAGGVGQAMIMGYLRSIPVKLGHLQLEFDFAVVTSEDLLLLGGHQMEQFNCIIDLDRQCLIFGGDNGPEVPFLYQSPPPVDRPGCRIA
mmetsp:Transcript_96942/g.313009  ORF Transcript_96942/g.313009 Transcript_96942/m.313009 type:complete len:165 (-) Transcript_96942:27-521(-)